MQLRLRLQPKVSAGRRRLAAKVASRSVASSESPPPPTDTSFEAIRKRLGTEPGTLADFEAEYGPIRPPDGDQGLRCPEPSPDSSAG
jgi:hypothetical protein